MLNRPARISIHNINFNHITDENKTGHNLRWSYIPDHVYRILIIGGSGSGKTKCY